MSFSRPIDHKEYIRLKYLGQAPDDVVEKKLRKKSKVKAATKKSNIRVFDDDLDLKKIKSNADDDELEIQYGTQEEKPSIAMIIDERSDELKRKDKNQGVWKPIAPTDDTLETTTPSTSSQPSTSKSTHSLFKSRAKHIIKKEPHDDDDVSPPRVRRRHESDEDLSPPRIKPGAKSNSPGDISPPRIRKRHSDDDLSPPRPKKSDPSPPRVRRRRDSDSDSSPPRSRRGDRRGEESRRSTTHHKRDPSPQRNKLGLTQEEMGRGAKTIYRDRSTGKKRDMEAEANTKVKPDPEEEELKRKYERWSKGIKQVAAKDERTQEVLKEMDKPLARYDDDEDRDKLLKERELQDDPMLQYMRKKKQKEEVKKSTSEGKVHYVMPKYKGPPAPPNRYGIEPGYRWDGVDRSNGFEKKLMSKSAERSANLDEAYKWSTEDM